MSRYRITCLVCFLMTLSSHSPASSNPIKEEMLFFEGSGALSCSDLSQKPVRFPFKLKIDEEGGQRVHNDKRVILSSPISKRTLALIEKGVAMGVDTGHFSTQVVSFYINGNLVKTTGSHDPYSPAMGRYTVIPVSASLLTGKRENCFSIGFLVGKKDRVAHYFSQAPVIGPIDDIYHGYYLRMLPGAALISVYVVVGLVFLILGLRRIGETYNLYFSIFSIALAAFIMTNLPIKEVVFGDNTLLNMRVDQASLNILIAAFSLFAVNLLLKKHPRFILLVSAYALLCSVLAMFRDFSFNFNDRFSVSFLSIVAGVPYIYYHLIKETVKKNRDAQFLVVSITLFFIAAIHDTLRHIKLLEGPLIAHIVALGCFLSVLLLLVYRFVKNSEDLEDLNLNLQSVIEVKTDELRSAHETITLINRKQRFLDSFGLTTREREILSLLMEGLSAGDVAQQLYISKRTVNNHIYNMYKKMDVHSHLEILSRFNTFQ